MRIKKSFVNCLLIMIVMIMSATTVNAQLRIEGPTDVTEGTSATYRLVNVNPNYTSINWSTNGSYFGGGEYLNITWNYAGQGYINVVVYTPNGTYYADLTVYIRKKPFSSRDAKNENNNEENSLAPDDQNGDE